jgi:hypothetical protein
MVDSFQKRDRERRKRQKRQEKAEKRRERSTEPNPSSQSGDGQLGTALGTDEAHPAEELGLDAGAAPLADQVLPGSDRSKPHREESASPAIPNRPEAFS